MRSLLAVVIFGACTHHQPPAPSNVARAVIADPEEVVIDPDSAELRSKRRYWKKVARAYMSQVPGPVCICESVPSLTYDTPTGPQTTYMTTCSTYH